MNLQYFDKDTVFNNLPEDIRRKIIELKNQSEQKIEYLAPPPLLGFDDLYVPIVKRIADDFVSIIENTAELDELKTGLNAEDAYNKAVKEHNMFVDLYRSNLFNTNVIDELENTIEMLENKYEAVNKEKRNKL